MLILVLVHEQAFVIASVLVPEVVKALVLAAPHLEIRAVKVLMFLLCFWLQRPCQVKLCYYKGPLGIQ